MWTGTLQGSWIGGRPVVLGALVLLMGLGCAGCDDEAGAASGPTDTGTDGSASSEAGEGRDIPAPFDLAETSEEPDTSDALDAGDPIDASDTADTPLFPDLGTSELLSLELDLESDGGEDGRGGTDYHLHGGVLTVFKPWNDPNECSAALTERQGARLLAAAEEVDWSGVAPSYRGDNPYCCCDQIGGELAVDLAFADDVVITVNTEWCGEPPDPAGMPEALLDFLQVLARIGEEVAATCRDETFVDIELDLETSGGFAGQGTRDYHLADGVLAVHDPFADPHDCSVTLSDDQTADLLAAASVVDWDAIEASYRDPDNLDCCCDQFIYVLTVSLTTDSADVQTVNTDWCSESFMSGRMPQDLLAFLDVLGELGDEVWGTCE